MKTTVFLSILFLGLSFFIINKEKSIELNEEATDRTRNLIHINDRYIYIVEMNSIISLLNQAIEYDSTYTLPYANKAKLLCRQGKVEDAIHTLKKIVSIKPDYFEAVVGIGQYFEKIGVIDSSVIFYFKAKEIINNGLREKNNSDLKYLYENLIFVEMLLDNKKEALSIIDKQILKYPNDLDLLGYKDMYERFDRKRYFENVCKIDKILRE